MDSDQQVVNKELSLSVASPLPLGIRDSGFGLGFRGKGSGFRVQGLGFKPFQSDCLCKSDFVKQLSLSGEQVVTFEPMEIIIPMMSYLLTTY